MNIGWNFPSSNYGTIKGISEAGIETFRGNLFQSLAKEICQNSLDARVNMDKPVKLEFMLTSVPKCEIDGFGELYKAMALCKDYWKDNIKAFRFFSEAVKTCENEFLRVLRISDFNTTGLTGSNEYKSSPWQNLVKSSGVSDKNGISGGSYGIGKSAPFACSDLRTVYYSTLDNEGVQAYQGVANLASFKLEDKLFKEGGVTQGTGYYGDKKTNAAVHTQFPMGGFIREESGTDIYILGFIKSEEWKDDIVKANYDFNDDYQGRKFNLQKGAILAIANQYNFKIDKEKEDLSQVPSIFTIYKKETTDETEAEIELYANKIRIGLNICDYENYNIGVQRTPDIINSFIILPALTYAFEQIKANYDDFKEYRWFRAIEKIFKKYSMTFNEDLLNTKSSFELAQKVMRCPISKSLKHIVEIDNDGEGE